MHSQFEDELELEDEWESELEDELEEEFESEWEDEDEAFWGQLGAAAARAILPMATSAAASYGTRRWAKKYGARYPRLSRYSFLAPPAVGALTSILQNTLWESEAEFEEQLETMSPHEADAMMDVVARRAAETEDAAEAEAFLGALIPLALKAAPLIAKVAPTILSVGSSLLSSVLGRAPAIKRRLTPKVTRVGRMMWRKRRTRRYVRTLPGIIRRTIRDTARSTARGRTPSTTAMQRHLARTARRTLANRRRRLAALRAAHRRQRKLARLRGRPCRCY